LRAWYFEGSRRIETLNQEGTMTAGKSNIVIALGVIAILAMVTMPMPTLLLDGLMMMMYIPVQ
jgi:flagellar biosynthesis component FlhA